MGAEFRTGQEAPSLAELKNQGYTNVIYAIGAWKHGVLRLESGRALNSLEFLKANRENQQLILMENRLSSLVAEIQLWTVLVQQHYGVKSLSGLSSE